MIGLSEHGHFARMLIGAARGQAIVDASLTVCSVSPLMGQCSALEKYPSLPSFVCSLCRTKFRRTNNQRSSFPTPRPRFTSLSFWQSAQRKLTSDSSAKCQSSRLSEPLALCRCCATLHCGHELKLKAQCPPQHRLAETPFEATLPSVYISGQL